MAEMRADLSWRPSPRMTPLHRKRGAGCPPAGRGNWATAQVPSPVPRRAVPRRRGYILQRDQVQEARQLKEAQAAASVVDPDAAEESQDKSGPPKLIRKDLTGLDFVGSQDQLRLHARAATHELPT